MYIYSSPINQKAGFTPVPGDQAGLKFSGGYVQKLNTHQYKYIYHLYFTLKWLEPHSLAKSCVIYREETRGVSHCGLAIYIEKCFKAKEELWKLKYFTMQNNSFQKNPLKETKIFQDIITNSVTNLKFQHKPKYRLSKILI